MSNGDAANLSKQTGEKYLVCRGNSATTVLSQGLCLRLCVCWVRMWFDATGPPDSSHLPLEGWRKWKGLRGAAVGEKNHKTGISELRTLTKLTLLHTECTALRRASKGQCSLSPSAPWASLTSQFTSRCWATLDFTNRKSEKNEDLWMGYPTNPA